MQKILQRHEEGLARQSEKKDQPRQAWRRSQRATGQLCALGRTLEHPVCSPRAPSTADGNGEDQGTRVSRRYPIINGRC